MAKYDINFTPNPEKGISYTVITDDSNDWNDVPSNTYFYDKDTNLPYYKNSNDDILSVFSTGGTGNTIYSANDTLDGNRIVDLDGNVLSFDTDTGGKLQLNRTDYDSSDIFEVNGYTSAGDSPFFKIGPYGNVSMMSRLNATGFKIFKGGSTSEVCFDTGGNGGGGFIGKGVVTIGEDISSYVHYNHSTTSYSFNRWYRAGNIEHCFNFNTSNPASFTGFYINGISDYFVIGSNLQIGDEKISLQGDTLISEKLELSSKEHGILLNRVTTPEMDLITGMVLDEIVFNTTSNHLFRYDGTNWVPLVVGTGILGVSDTNGVPTFYTSYTAAMSAATDGQTVTQYGNITETDDVTIDITEGVNVNMNGYTYTLDGSNNTAFDYTAIDTNTKFINGTVIKKNSPTQGIGGGNGLVVGQQSDLDCSGLTVISDGYTVLNFNTSGNGQGLITNGNFIYNGTNTGYICFVQGKLDKAVINTGTGVLRVIGGNLYNSTIYGGVTTSSESIIKNCIINNTLNATALSILAGAKSYNCNVYSQNSDAISLNDEMSECHNSTGKSDGNIGINVTSGKIYNSTGISTSAVGMSINLPEAEASFSTGESSISSGIDLRAGKLINCVGRSTHDDPSGHAIILKNSTGMVIDCIGIVKNSSAFAIQGISSVRTATIIGLKGTGMDTLIGNLVSNTQIHTTDSLGNILIG
jgi:hypothetical protein